MEEQKEKDRIFSHLLSQVINEARNDFSIEEVKDFFEDEINSRRSLEKAVSLKEVFYLLQKRDLLSWQKVRPLEALGELLGNERIKDIVHCYKKTCLDEDDLPCSVCSLIMVPNLAPVPLQGRPLNQNCVTNTRNNTANDSFNGAIENVALSIGPKWGVLARELGLIEIQIEKCIETHPRDNISQARMALKIWRQKEKENASIERLDRALEARLCKIKGFGRHLKNPIVGVNC